jgi:hypothetical protein
MMNSEIDPTLEIEIMKSVKLNLSRHAVELAKKLLSQKNILNIKEIPETRAGDELFSYILFRRCHGREPSNQMLFNDVLYKIKTSDEILDPLRVFVTDKEFVKIFIKAIVGDQYNVPTIAILRDITEVDTYDFPSSCCIKPTQTSGKIILRNNSEPLNREEIKKWFYINFYRDSREANYKSLKPKVIVEPLIFNTENVEDYKFFCLNGVPKLIQVDINRRQNHERMIFDADWIPQSFTIEHPRSKRGIAKPDNLEEMLQVVENLSKYFGFVRVDLYSNGEQCLVGEITNCHGNATEKFIPREGEIEASKIIFES